ncbi:3-oxoacyl-reductase [Exophiala viscosa]|uniref:3-oxoacyl-reductase n=1 Tax=Exophiala viscosa TaxID=2486360 RepID=UPI0021976D7D|nr:3-oxoacyl-reductase [Exophiala viscosa]
MSQPSTLTTDLKPHLALITGATGGIGKATSLALARLGCSIAVHYNSAADTARELVEQLQHLGVKASAFQADLSSYDAARKLHADVVREMGKPTILFNNAGLTMGKSGVKEITDISIEEFEQTWRANCGTAFLLTQLCIPDMVEKGWGRVIFCSSVAGFTGGVVGPHYASSKSAMHGLIHWLAGAYGKKGITVNGVAPALIEETKMLPGSNAELAARIPIGRLGKPEEIAETVVWMVKTGYVHNKVIAVDGGWFIQ